jgi:hypothetical protein
VKRNPILFKCSKHKYYDCGDNREDFTHSVQYRRCPKVWHVNCMPSVKYWTCFDKGYTWKDGYCDAHPIDEEFGTPSIDHVNFEPKILFPNKVGSKGLVKKK